MTAAAYEAGLAAFRESIASYEKEHAGKVFRAGGRATKAFPNKEDKSWWMAEGPNMVHAYYNWRASNPNLDIWTAPNGVPAIELEVNVALPDGTMLKSYIDRIFADKNTGDLMIVDLKTGKPPATALQLGVYRLALQQTFDAAPRYGAYWMGRQGGLDTVHDLAQFPPETVAFWMQDVATMIRSGFFVPHVSQRCGFCSVKSHCYAWNPSLNPNRDFALTTHEEGETQ